MTRNPDGRQYIRRRRFRIWMRPPFAHALKAYPAVSSGVIAKHQVILSI